MPKFILIFFTFFFFASVHAQQKTYSQVDKKHDADFNYAAIKQINSYSDRRKVFEPVSGKFTVYTFIATYKGTSYRDEKEHDFHDILIIKTGKNNAIIDAYQFTLEWAEMPLTFDLYKAGSKGIKLKDGLLVEKLNLNRVEYYQKKDRKNKEKAVLKLQKDQTTKQGTLFVAGWYCFT